MGAKLALLDASGEEPSIEAENEEQIDADQTTNESKTETKVALIFFAPIANGSVPVVPNLMPVNPPHGQRCNCGCVTNIPSLFEMAEMRRQAKLKQQQGP